MEQHLVPANHPDDDWRRKLSTVLPWMHRYLVARTATEDEQEAVRKARVSVAIVQRECKRNPEFAALRQEAIERTLVLGTEDATRIARESSGPIMAHVVDRATDPTVLPRDQATFSRLAFDAAHVTGAQGPNVVIYQTGVNLFQAMAQGPPPQELKAQEQTPPSLPQGAPESAEAEPEQADGQDHKEAKAR